METIKKIGILFLILVCIAGTAIATKDYAMAKETDGTGGDTNASGDTGGTGGTEGTGGTGTVTTVIIFEKTLNGTISGEDLAAIMSDAGYSQEDIDAAIALQGKAEITQTVIVEKITSATGLITYKTTVTITIKNSSNMDWQNVKIIVEIPKAIAANASEITSPLSFTVLKADPIIEFTTNIPTGTSKTISWSVAKFVSETNLDTLKAPIIAKFTETVPVVNKCLGITCNDNNPCTIDNCDPTTGNCSYNNAADEVICGTGMVCQAGACVTKTILGTTTELPIIAIIIAIILIIAIAYYFLVMKKK